VKEGGEKGWFAVESAGFIGGVRYSGLLRSDRLSQDPEPTKMRTQCTKFIEERENRTPAIEESSEY